MGMNLRVLDYLASYSNDKSNLIEFLNKLKESLITVFGESCIKSNITTDITNGLGVGTSMLPTFCANKASTTNNTAGYVTLTTPEGIYHWVCQWNSSSGSDFLYFGIESDSDITESKMLTSDCSWQMLNSGTISQGGQIKILIGWDSTNHDIVLANAYLASSTTSHFCKYSALSYVPNESGLKVISIGNRNGCLPLFTNLNSELRGYSISYKVVCPFNTNPMQYTGTVAFSYPIYIGTSNYGLRGKLISPVSFSGLLTPANNHEVFVVNGQSYLCLYYKLSVCTSDVIGYPVTII